jgi:hypothetical protein
MLTDYVNKIRWLKKNIRLTFFVRLIKNVEPAKRVGNGLIGFTPPRLRSRENKNASNLNCRRYSLVIGFLLRYNLNVKEVASTKAHLS